MKTRPSPRRTTAGPTVAAGEVEHPVRPELGTVPVVQDVGLLDGAEQDLGARRVRHVRVVGDRVLDQERLVARVLVDDVEAPVLRVVGVKGHPGQPGDAEPDRAEQVEERLGAQETVLDDDDVALLLGHEQARGVAGRRGQPGGPLEAPEHTHGTERLGVRQAR